MHKLCGAISPACHSSGALSLLPSFRGARLSSVIPHDLSSFRVMSFRSSFRTARSFARRSGIHSSQCPAARWIPDRRFASSGMTCGYGFALSRHPLPELCASCPRIRGRREDRAASATRSSACKNKKHADKSPQVCRTSPGLPCANGFNGFLRARPGDRALVSPWVTPLTRCTGYQRRDIRPTRLHRPRIKRIRLARCPRPSHPAPNVRDDRDTPLFSGARRAKNCQ
jgi:hypothetical protein